MAHKRMKELKKLSKSELETRARELEAAIFQGRFKSKTGQLANVASLWLMRKDLARAKTLLTGLTRQAATAK